VDVMKKNHIADYQRYFNRVSFTLNGNPTVDLPTDERLLQYAGVQRTPL